MYLRGREGGREGEGGVCLTGVVTSRDTWKGRMGSAKSPASRGVGERRCRGAAKKEEMDPDVMQEVYSDSPALGVCAWLGFVCDFSVQVRSRGWEGGREGAACCLLLLLLMK